MTVVIPELPPPSFDSLPEANIFISYSSEDRAFVSLLAQSLEENKYRVWVDYDSIRGGDSWKQSISDGIHSSLIVLLVLTPDSVRSEWVEVEISLARRLGKRIIPLLLRTISSTIVHENLAEVYNEKQWEDLREPSRTGFGKVLEILPPLADFIVPGHCKQLKAELEERSWGLDFYMQEEARLLPVNGTSDGETNNVLTWMREHNRLLVLGEPGVGKTVALERLAWEFTSEPTPKKVPIFINLWEYDGRPLLEWIRLNLTGRGYIQLSDLDSTNSFLKDTRFDFYILLDGLNEVPVAHRDAIISELRALASNSQELNFSLIVTSRSNDKLAEQFRHSEVLRPKVVQIQPIERVQIQSYLHYHLGRDNGEALWLELESNPIMRDLATIPLLLRFLKDFRQQQTTPDQHGHSSVSLPANRGELYQHIIHQMLDRDELRIPSRVTKRQRIEALKNLAWYMQENQRILIDEDTAFRIVGDEEILAAVRSSGFLSGDVSLRFAPHQTMQEHFAARKALDIGISKVKHYANRSWWYETFIHIAGLAHDINGFVKELSDVNPWLALWCAQEVGTVYEETQRAIEARTVELVSSPDAKVRRQAAHTLSQLESARTLEFLARLSFDTDIETTREALTGLLKMGEDGEVVLNDALITHPPQSRATWGRNIADIDSRKGIGTTSIGLPEIDWVEIPDDGEWSYQNGRYERLPGFFISRYPISHAQFQAFLEDPEGIQDDRWWTGFGKDYKDIEKAQGYLNHPREQVNWYQALAFCRWYSWRLNYTSEYNRVSNWAIRLPTEHEWEKAARGTEGLIYPYGNGFDPRKGNTLETGIHRSSAVGIFPDGASPYGVLDLSGNVWEWCIAKPILDIDIDLSRNNSWVLRGGSWESNSSHSRATYRLNSFPFNAEADYSFRVVCTRPPIT